MDKGEGKSGRGGLRLRNLGGREWKDEYEQE